MIISKDHLKNAYSRLREGRLPPGTTPRTVAATVAVLDMAARGHAHTNRLGLAMETDEMIKFILSFDDVDAD